MISRGYKILCNNEINIRQKTYSTKKLKGEIRKDAITNKNRLRYRSPKDRKEQTTFHEITDWNRKNMKSSFGCH